MMILSFLVQKSSSRAGFQTRDVFFFVWSQPQPHLGSKVLHDDLLHVTPVVSVRVAYREQRVQPLLARLSDADEYPRRERHSQVPGEVGGAQSTGGSLRIAPVIKVRPFIVHSSPHAVIVIITRRRLHSPPLCQRRLSPHLHSVLVHHQRLTAYIHRARVPGSRP